MVLRTEGGGWRRRAAACGGLLARRQDRAARQRGGALLRARAHLLRHRGRFARSPSSRDRGASPRPRLGHEGQRARRSRWRAHGRRAVLLEGIHAAFPRVGGRSVRRRGAGRHSRLDLAHRRGAAPRRRCDERVQHQERVRRSASKGPSRVRRRSRARGERSVRKASHLAQRDTSVFAERRGPSPPAREGDRHLREPRTLPVALGRRCHAEGEHLGRDRRARRRGGGGGLRDAVPRTRTPHGRDCPARGKRFPAGRRPRGVDRTRRLSLRGLGTLPELRRQARRVHRTASVARRTRIGRGYRDRVRGREG